MSTITRIKFNEDVKDYAPNMATTVNNGVTFVAGKTSKAGRLNGSAGYCDITTALGSASATKGAVSFWFRFVGAIDTSPRIFDTAGFGNNIIRIEGISNSDFSDGLEAKFGDGSQVTVVSQDFSDGSWYHVIITFDAVTGDYITYIDNGAGNTVAATFTTIDHSIVSTRRFGASASGSSLNESNIDIDDFKIYDHILTARERRRSFYYVGSRVNEIEIGGVDYRNILNLEVNQSIADYTRSASVTFKDDAYAKRDAISQDDDTRVYMEGTKVFRGKVGVKKPTSFQTLGVEAADYYQRFLDIHVSGTFSSTIASTILTSLLSTFYPGEFTTSGVQATTITRDRNYKSVLMRNAIKELANIEKHVAYLDVDLDFKFQPETFVDSGKHYSTAKGTAKNRRIYDDKFKASSQRLVNSVLVVYGASLDKTVKRKNYTSVGVFKERQKVEPASHITTLEEAADYGDYLLAKFEQEVKPATIQLALDPLLETGQIIHVTLPTAGFVDLPFVVLEHHLSITPPRSTVKIGLATENTAEILEEQIRKMRNVEEQSIAATQLTVDSVDDFFSELRVASTITIDRRTLSGALAGEFVAASQVAGTRQSISWTNLVNAQPVVISNKGLENIGRILSQIATVPADLDNPNAHIALGTGTDAAEITDTALTTETLREGMEPAYPLSGSPATMAHQIIITDAELPSGNFREFALMNASAAGDLFGRYVHPSNIAKVADEEIRVTFDTAFTGDLAFIAVGLALIRDLQIGAVGDFLDSSNAAIEVQGSATYREAVNSPTPIFTVTSFDKIKWQITIVNPGEFATGGTITQVDLYNKTSGGVQVLTLTVPTITTIATEDNVIRQFIEIVRI